MNLENLQNTIGKKLETSFTFLSDGESFSAINTAEKFLKDAGFSVGSMERNSPIGIVKGLYIIAKWSNLTEDDKKMLNGVITSNDFRDGDVTIFFSKE